MNTKELITIVKSKFAEQSVSARELHQKLGVRSRYNDWIKQMIDYGFEENKDYIAVTEKKVTAQGNESTLKSHYISLDMAKEICMLQRSDIGRAFRKYFIEVEKEFSTYKFTRAKSKVARNRFTEELKERGYNKPHEYIQTTKQMKNTLQIKNKKDEMNIEELTKVTAAEALTELLFTSEYGYSEVNPVCVEASEIIQKAIAQKKNKKLA